MVICLELDADLHMAHLMPLPLTVSCFSKIQIGFAFLVPAYLGSPGKGATNGCVCDRLKIPLNYGCLNVTNLCISAVLPEHVTLLVCLCD